MRQGFQQKNIVIIGAGFSGILCAQRLEKRTSRLKNISITLIDKNPYFTMRTEIHAAATGRGKPEGIQYDLAETFADSPNVSFFCDEVTDIDFENKVVKGNVNDYTYDYLVIAAGSQPNFFGIESAKENALPFWTFDDAMAVKKQINDCFKKAAELSDEEEIKKLLTFCVVGAGLTGVELAGELAEYIPMLCVKYKLPQGYTKVLCIDAAPRCIPNLTNKLSTTCSSILTEMGVELQMNAKVVDVTPEALVYEQLGKTVTVPSCTVVWSAGITSEDITIKAAQTLDSRNNRIVNLETLQSSDPNVFVIGDNMYYVAKGKDYPVPQMVENTEQSSVLAADNIADLITGHKAKRAYKPAMHGCMISLGAKKGIAYAGLENLFMIQLPSIPAQLAKRAINVYFLVPVFGLKNALPIAKHEFLAKRDVEN
ncbi:MAG: NAD(P)/FAD-dependent oxidoreductase [Clostridia bacterium]|nr:NAD(P)/FAD-dependent oxidoreductase [Clostridia bacterium]